MRLYFLLSLSISFMAAKGQTVPPIYSPGQPPPLFDTVKEHWPKQISDKDRITALEKRVNFLTRDLLETHRRLDSLINSITLQVRPGRKAEDAGASIGPSALWQNTTGHYNVAIGGPQGIEVYCDTCAKLSHQ